MLPIRLLVGLLLLALPVPAQAQQEPVLHRGLNLAGWIANAPRQPLFLRDFMQIKAAGFDHVRLPFNPEYYGFKLTQEGGDTSHIDFIALDRALAMADQAGLPVILDIHPSDEFVAKIQNYPWAEREFIDLWKAINQRYRDHSHAALLFELLNEPQYYKSEAGWTGLASRLVAAIHGTDPERVLIVGAPHGSDIDALPYLEPLIAETGNDPHILYAFHFYEPYVITLQGVHMGFDGKAVRYFGNLPYPSDLADKPVTAYLHNAPNLAEAQNEFADYLQAPWNADHVKARIQIAKDWADAHHVRVIAGEFGVLRNHIDPDSRYRWIHDVRAAFDADGIAWELWDYDDLCGIAPPVGATSTDPVDGSVRLVDPEKGSRRFEPQALTALGLAR
ncbi:MAG: cellulase family glycosylhydrolase [Alphaproteobacteria bacterium]|nr:cellulase family glycosylhydrolase [Alphaproteobacteria bacterium]